MTQIVAPSDDLLVGCPIAPPPSREHLTFLRKSEYAELTPREQQAAVNSAIRATTKAYMEQTSNLMICNERLNQLRNWKRRVLKQKEAP